MSNVNQTINQYIQMILISTFRLKDRVFDGAAAKHAPMLCIPFKFNLPKDIPGSFHGKCGQIKYVIVNKMIIVS